MYGVPPKDVPPDIIHRPPGHYSPVNNARGDIIHSDSVTFSDVILGIDWIDHRPTQLFITEFLSQLKAARTAILQSRP